MTWYQGSGGEGAPSASFDHSANLVGGTKIIISGGWNGNDFFNDVYVLDLEIMAWSKPAVFGPATGSHSVGSCAAALKDCLRSFMIFYFLFSLVSLSNLGSQRRLKACPKMVTRLGGMGLASGPGACGIMFQLCKHVCVLPQLL